MKQTRFIVASDTHGDMIDPVSRAAVLAHIKEFRPQIRVHAGDAFDFRNLRKGASDDEKATSLADDRDAGASFLREFFDGGQQNHFLRGNHDERLWDFQNNCAGIFRDFANDGVKKIEELMVACNATMLPYDAALGVLKLGHLNIVHGYHAGANACRMHANVYGNCLFGHVHTIESAPVASLEPAEARSIGCLCVRDMDYINKKTGKLRWAQGWAYGLLFEDGSYQLFQTRKINGEFYAATNIERIGLGATATACTSDEGSGTSGAGMEDVCGDPRGVGCGRGASAQVY